MSQGRELFALDWVKGELLETLGEARQALEAYAEEGRDETRMRVCLTRMHQVHGTLVMLELTGVALLADYLERLAQGLLDSKVNNVDDACELLMQGMIELPQRLDHLQSGGDDSEHAVLALVNRSAALLGLDPVLAGSTKVSAQQRWNVSSELTVPARFGASVLPIRTFYCRFSRARKKPGR